MANVKISQLPVTGTPSTIGSIPIVQDGTTYSTTAADLVALVTNTDVTNALGYTPISPTTLATQLADYVPEVRTLTINGTTQDLSANRTFTIATGAPTYPFTGASITAGDAVVINGDGTISSVVTADPALTANASRKGFVDYGTYNTTPAYMARTIVSPNDPSFIVYGYIDGSSTALTLTATMSNDTQINTPLSSVVTVASGVTSFDMQFDPFNPDLILVIYNSGSTMYAQYVAINNTYANSSVPRLVGVGSQFSIGGNWTAFGFQFSVEYPNTVVAQYSDASNSNLPFVVSGLITQLSSNSFTFNLGTAYSLDTNGYTGPSNSIQTLNRLEGTDTFIASLHVFDGGVSAYINKVVLFKIDATYNDYSLAPALTLGTAQTMVDYTLPGFQYAQNFGAFFLSATKIAYAFKDAMAYNYYVVIGNVSGLTVSSIGTANLISDTTVGILNGSQRLASLPINGQQYMVFVGIPSLGVDSNNIIGAIGKVAGTTVTFANAGTLAINGGGVDGITIGLFLGGGMVAFTPSKEGGVVDVNLIWYTATGGAYLYYKTSTINYITKAFTNQTLLGIAQNTVTTSATVQVAPFGSVDENQTGLVAGTSYYLQDNGVLTTNVTPTLLGTALSATLIKTANYPTI